MTSSIPTDPIELTRSRVIIEKERVAHVSSHGLFGLANTQNAKN